MSATTISLGRAVMELGVDGAGLFKEIDQQLKLAAIRIKDVFGKDLKGSFKGLDDLASKFKDITGETNPLANGLSTVVGRVKDVAGGLAALGPAGAAGAVGVIAVAGAGTLLAGALGAAGIAIYKATTLAADMGDELFTLSNKTGITVEALSELKFVGQQADVPLEAITASIFKLGQTLSEGGDKAKKGLGAIGVSFDEIRKLSPDQAFKLVIERLHEIPDAGKRAAAGVALFGKGFKEIAQLTEEDMAGLTKQAHELGLVMSTEFAVAGDRFNDAVGAIGSQITAVTAKFGADFLPMAIALVETFGTNLTDALNVAAKGAGDFAGVVSKVSILIGQSLAAIVSVGAGTVLWLTELFGGRFLTDLSIIDKILGIADALLAVANAATVFDPMLGGAFALAQRNVDGVRSSVKSFSTDIVTAGGNVVKYAQAVKDAADKTGRDLPYNVAIVRAEIAKSAEEMRKAKSGLAGFGAGMDDVGDKSGKAAEALKKLNEERAETIAGMMASGAILTDFGSRLEALIASTSNWEQNLPRFGELMPMVKGYSVEAEIAATKTAMLEGAFKTLGLTSQSELDKTAHTATDAYLTIRDSGNASARDIEAAYKKMVAAVNEASGRIPSYWETVVGPRLKQIFGDLGRAFMDVLLGMRGQSAKEHQQLADDAIANYNRIEESARKEFDAIAADGTKTPKEIAAAHLKMATDIEAAHAAMQMAIEAASHPFRDTLVDLWKSLGQSIKNVFADVLNFFLGTFLKGILGALTGKGGLQQAFASFLPGLLGAGAAGLGGAALPAVAAGGTFGGLVPGGAAGGGAAAGGLAGALGGLGAGAAGLGLGWLGTKLFGGAGAAAGAFGGASGAATGALIGSIVPGIGTAIGALIGGLSGIIGGLFGKTAKTKTNDLRDQVLAQFGAGGTGEGSGFATLAAQLNQSTGSNALFESFLKADTPKKFADALALVNAALQENATKTAAAAAGESDHQKAIADTTAVYQKQIEAIQASMKDLNDEEARINASEAPEEHMGIEEQRSRERIARMRQQLETQMDVVRQAAAEALKAIEDASTGTSDAIGAAARAAAAAAAGAAQSAHDAFTKYHGEWTSGNWQAPPAYPQSRAQSGVEPPDSAGLGNSPYMPRPMDSGGFGTVTKPTLFLAGIHGSEQFAFSGEGKRFPESSSGSPQPVVIQQLTLNAPPNASPDWARRALEAIKEEARRGGAALDAARAIVRLTGATV